MCWFGLKTNCSSYTGAWLYSDEYDYQKKGPGVSRSWDLANGLERYYKEREDNFLSYLVEEVKESIEPLEKMEAQESEKDPKKKLEMIRDKNGLYCKLYADISKIHSKIEKYNGDNKDLLAELEELSSNLKNIRDHLYMVDCALEGILTTERKLSPHKPKKLNRIFSPNERKEVLEHIRKNVPIWQKFIEGHEAKKVTAEEQTPKKPKKFIFAEEKIPKAPFLNRLSRWPVIGRIAGVCRAALAVVHIGGHLGAAVIYRDKGHLFHVIKGVAELAHGIVEATPLIGFIFAHSMSLYDWSTVLGGSPAGHELRFCCFLVEIIPDHPDAEVTPGSCYVHDDAITHHIFLNPDYRI